MDKIVDNFTNWMTKPYGKKILVLYIILVVLSVAFEIIGYLTMNHVLTSIAVITLFCWAPIMILYFVIFLSFMCVASVKALPVFFKNCVEIHKMCKMKKLPRK